MEPCENISNEEKVCRLCGEMQRNMMQLSEDDNRDIICLVERTLGFINIKFSANSPLPMWLCVACHLDAESTENFLLMVEDGQRKFQQRMQEYSETIEKPSKHSKSEGFKCSENSSEINSELDNETTLGHKAQTDIETSETTQPLSKYPKRVRRKTRRFPCDPTPDLEWEQDTLGFETASKGSNSEEVSTGTLITIKPIAELRSANGASLAEIIAVNSEAPHATPADSEIRLICEYCKEVFTKQSQFLKHLRSHNESIYECTECTINFETLTELKQHQTRMGHKGMTILAKNKTTNNKTNQEKELTGEKSDATINIVVDDEGHITSIASDVNGRAEVKDYGSNSVAIAVEHVEQDGTDLSHKRNAFRCLKCNKLYPTRYSVLRHYNQVHIGARTYKCQHCTANFKNATNLAYHMAKHTGIRNFKCDICAKAFVHKTELTLHMRTHTGDKPYVCEHCPKSFAHRSNMVTHMRLHSGQLPFKCETCGAKFNSSSHCKQHKQTHIKKAQKAIRLQLKDQNNKNVRASEENQRKSVDICTNQSSSSVQSSEATSSLLRPKTTIVKSVKILPTLNAPPGPNAVLSGDDLQSLIQTSVPPDESESSKVTQLKFKCDQCLQRFKLKSALTKHLRTHTGERPYKCSLCPRTFADASNFKRHKSLHKTATEQLENVSKQYKSTNFLHELQRDKIKSFADGNVSPTHSVASDPDPDGLEAIGRANFISPRSVSDIYDDDSVILDIQNYTEREANQQMPNSSRPSTSASLLKVARRPLASKSPPRLICISYANPANPSDNKMTTFYV
ncbi:oocyte zinc finger protein XlCOF6-like [Anastrepha ludens]|uniref:oocyte zinc finger protein XlCOF6-like n=1 Tax=Anastrepha ludens TaxID=28586 RepID=UPI0023B048F8|nr:oocyte zinc finger protein XlCOF6-like [Anastrepha ludens]